MNTLVIDYGSKLIKYRVNNKDFVCNNTNTDVDNFIEWLIDRYDLCRNEELLVVLGIDSKYYLEMDKRVLHIDRQTTHGKHYKYKIQMFPSLVGISIENMDNFQEVYGIVDIGYSSVRYGMFKGGKINRNTITTIDYGTNVLYRSIVDMLKREHGIEGSEDGVYELLLNSSNTKIAKMFESYKFNYLETLKNKLIERNSAFTMVDNYVFGGNSEILREQINMDENLKYTSNTLYDVVRGIGKVVHLI